MPYRLIAASILVPLVGLPAVGWQGLPVSTPVAAAQRIPQFDNDSVKVWKSIIRRNAPLTLHRHDHGRTIVVLAGGDLKIIKESGQTTVVHWETGKAYWLTPDPPGELHKDVNEADRPIEVMVVEMK